jgi:hypothetical protein
MLVAAILISLGLSASSQHASLRLPAGVKSVAFGTAHRYYGPGKEMCVVVYPMPGGVFERGVTEISYAVELEPQTVKSAAARVIAPGGQEIRAAACNVFMPIKGGFTQTQLGSTLSRVDKGSLRPGEYTLRITVDGQTAEVPFSIK